ncbi:hypothetical protein [Sphaerisporangium corydalis]|uniref:WXG100 family type VII secretion target n=1 Tax=Sphaerisporangium corydalis TaxID=1441875 RepID=A0ABV9EKW2_9ACTN|nr:hypothetical protein [Sphaerisporangium corydalis]
MGVTKADVITSAPSVSGAAQAVAAAYVLPLVGLPIAAALTTFVSDPAQIWHAADRFEHVATLVRSAGTLLGDEIAAGTREWNEKGKDAFVTSRVEPYGRALDEAAAMYDDLGDTLKSGAVAYSTLGIASAVIGAATLAIARTAFSNGLAGQAVGNAALAGARERVVSLTKYVDEVNRLMAKIFSHAASQVIKNAGVRRFSAFAVNGALTGVPGAYILSGPFGSALTGDVRTVPWPKEIKDGEPVPTGYRAAQSKDLKLVHPDAIRALGKALESTVGATLGRALDAARTNEVGLPGFGVIGIPVAHAFSAVRNGAADQLAGGVDTVGTWLPMLATAGGNWAVAEKATTDAVHGR